MKTVSRLRRLSPRNELTFLQASFVALCLGACVPATSYEQATSAIEVEAERHRRTTLKLSATQAELRRMQGENEKLNVSRSTLEKELLEEEHRLAQVSLDKETTKKEHEQQVELVSQLRGELARVGQHIQVAKADQDELSAKLSAAEAQAVRLRAEIAELTAEAQSSEVAQAQLQGALTDLEALQEEVAQQSEPDSEPKSSSTQNESTEAEAVNDRQDEPDPVVEEPNDAEERVEVEAPANEKEPREDTESEDTESDARPIDESYSDSVEVEEVLPVEGSAGD